MASSTIVVLVGQTTIEVSKVLLFQHQVWSSCCCGERCGLFVAASLFYCFVSHDNLTRGVNFVFRLSRPGLHHGDRPAPVALHSSASVSLL
jgi:hypothetical protein